MVLKNHFITSAAIAAYGIQLGACSTLPYNLSDPQYVAGIGYDPNKVLKSLRCEVITFIEENKIRSAIQADLASSVQNSFKKNLASFEYLHSRYEYYKSIKIDAARFAGIFTEFKNINSLSATLGADWKYPSQRFPNSRSITDRVGLSYSDTATYDLQIPMAISQSASLGPAETYGRDKNTLPIARHFSTAYFEQPSVDEHFYCYKSLSELMSSSTIYNAADDIQNLLVNSEGWQAYPNFDRIYVGSQTLAHWLQTTAIAAASNQSTVFATPENAFIGQLAYYFTLDVKPGADLKYTLVGKILNPLVPSITASIDHAATFSIYINTDNVLDVLGSKNGNSLVPPEMIPNNFYRRFIRPSALKPPQTSKKT